MTQVPPQPGSASGHFPVSVVLERRPATSQWVDHVWRAAGITVGRLAAQRELQVIREEHGVAYFLSGGLEVRLHVDECESYYHNIMSDTPRAFVVAHLTDDGVPDPFLVSLSSDEAHAYLEGSDEIYAVDIPPELYRWTEAFVLANYYPEKKTKRRRQDWQDSGPGARRQ